jgi:hypothetical protein
MSACVWRSMMRVTGSGGRSLDARVMPNAVRTVSTL